MKTPKLFLVALLFTAPFLLLAQTNASDPTAPLPTDVGSYWEYGIAAITPILVWAFARFGPKVPVMLLPLLAPVVAIILGVILNKLASADLGWVDMAKAGGLAVFIRELTNQLVTNRITSQPIKMTGAPAK
jgi:hypothetical protein